MTATHTTDPAALVRRRLAEQGHPPAVCDAVEGEVRRYPGLIPWSPVTTAANIAYTLMLCHVVQAVVDCYEDRWHGSLVAERRAHKDELRGMERDCDSRVFEAEEYCEECGDLIEDDDE